MDQGAAPSTEVEEYPLEELVRRETEIEMCALCQSPWAIVTIFIVPFVAIVGLALNAVLGVLLAALWSIALRVTLRGISALLPRVYLIRLERVPTLAHHVHRLRFEKAYTRFAVHASKAEQKLLEGD
ncbi:MAG: hypothetical protein V4674_00525 [Patescibacteria group bacterium]